MQRYKDIIIKLEECHRKNIQIDTKRMDDELIVLTQTENINQNLLDWLLTEAKSENSYAQNILGYLYSTGLYVTKNTKIALEFCIASANNGHRQSMRNVGILLQKEDYKTSAKYFRMAIDKGSFLAKYDLATLIYNTYMEDKKMVENGGLVEVEKLFLSCAEENYSPAYGALAKLYTYCTRDERTAAYWLSKYSEGKNKYYHLPCTY